MSKLTPWFCFWVTRQSHSGFLCVVAQIYISNWHLKCKRSTQSASPCHEGCWTMCGAQHAHIAVGHCEFTSCIFVTSDHTESKKDYLACGHVTCYEKGIKRCPWWFYFPTRIPSHLQQSAETSPHILRIPGWSKLEVYLMHFTHISSYLFLKN